MEDDQNGRQLKWKIKKYKITKIQNRKGPK